MKNGDLYHGFLATFGILGDEVKSKDFLIKQVRYYPGGDESREEVLDPGFGGVLLNSADVDAIEFIYAS